MNTPMEAMDAPQAQPRLQAAMTIAPLRTFYWAVRRELWEVRSIYVVPLAAAALIVVAYLISTVHLPSTMRSLSTLSAMQQQEAVQQPFNFAALLIMLSTLIVAIFYCLEALHGERKDRSILFWKSLPVSDLTTVLAKGAIPLLVLPAVTFAVTLVTQWLMLLTGSAVLLAHGQGPGLYWSLAAPLPMWLMLFFHLFAIHSLWYAPIFGWLLLVSGWARRVPLLWALLPLLILGLGEKIAFNTTHFASMLGDRLGGASGVPFADTAMSMDMLSQLSPGSFFASPGLWIGLVLTALFLAVAVKLRPYRGPI